MFPMYHLINLMMFIALSFCGNLHEHEFTAQSSVNVGLEGHLVAALLCIENDFLSCYCDGVRI